VHVTSEMPSYMEKQKRPLDPLLWVSILEDSKLSEVLVIKDWLSRSMNNSNLIHSDLSTSCQTTLSMFFAWEKKRMEGGGGVSSTQKEAKQRKI
jgi:hypothetical protein